MEATFPVGTCVEISGLVKAVSLNFQQGYVMSFHNSTGRYEVQLNDDGSTKFVKPDNLKRVEVFDCEGAISGAPSEDSGTEG